MRTDGLDAAGDEELMDAWEKVEDKLEAEWNKGEGAGPTSRRLLPAADIFPRFAKT